MHRKKTKIAKTKDSKYSFKAPLWKYKGKSAWYFVTCPVPLSKKIRKVHFASEEGWGRLKTKATMGHSTWNTSIWFDSKLDAYILPVKSLIRTKEKLKVGNIISVKLEFKSDQWLMSLPD